MAAGCARGGPVSSANHGFPTEEQRQLACLDLRDHIVALYADAYAQGEGLAMSDAERTAFHAGWQEQLAKRGTFEPFEQSCFFSLTPRRYRCGMASRSPDTVAACMAARRERERGPNHRDGGVRPAKSWTQAAREQARASRRRPPCLSTDTRAPPAPQFGAASGAPASRSTGTAPAVSSTLLPTRCRCCHRLIAPLRISPMSVR